MRSAISLGLCVLCVLLGYACTSDGSGNNATTPSDCADACSRIAAADCGDIGNGCFDSCVKQGTGDYGRDDCNRELGAYQICFFQAASYTCDAQSQTQPVGCDAERATALDCVGLGGAGGGSGESAGGAAGALVAGGGAGGEG